MNGIEGLPYTHPLDQDTYWRDPAGRQWDLALVPPGRALELMESLLGSALSLLVTYTNQVRELHCAALEMGLDVALDFEPDSAPYYDRLFEAELTGAPMAHEDKIEVARDWVRAKPLYAALERRSRGQHPAV